MYYFAYGSNLNEVDFSEWAVAHGHDPQVMRMVSLATLPEQKVCFSYRSRGRNGGVLNVCPRRGHAVPGAIFEVSNWDALDQKEGAPNVYKRVECTVVLPDGTLKKAITYVVHEHRREEFVRPHPNYLRIVCEGLKALGHPVDHVMKAAENKPAAITCNNLFVYGTLMRGEHRHSAIQKHHPKCLLMADCVGNLLDLGGFPGMVNAEQHTERVNGEFVKFDDISDVFEELDRIEGFYGYGNPDNLYNRWVVTIDAGDGRLRDAWVYVPTSQTAARGRPIMSNCWRHHRGVWESSTTMIATAHLEGQEARVIGLLVMRGLIPDDPQLNPIQLIAEALRRGTLSERRLAQASGRWNICLGGESHSRRASQHRLQ